MKKKIVALITLAAVGVGLTASAEIVYVTARPSPCTVTANCPGPNTDGTYSEQLAGFTIGDFGAVGTAVGHPPTTVARTYIGGTSITDPNFGVTLTPTLGTPGGVYRIDYNFNSLAGNTSTNVVFTVTCTSGGTLSFTTTDVFQRSFGNPANRWNTMGYLTNNPGSATPTIEFRYLSGEVNGGTQNRLLFDCWRFVLVEPCLEVPVVSIAGPLGVSPSEVVVAGVSATATAVTVYQDSGSGMVAIGTKTTGITAGNNVVSVSGLVKGAKVAATQTVGGQEGCKPQDGVGVIVGGGANPSVRLALSVRETATAGPIGQPGSTASTFLHFVGASTVSGGAPVDAPIISPGAGWQTVTFDLGRQTIGNSGNVVGAVGVPANNMDAYPAFSTIVVQVHAYKTIGDTTIYSPVGVTNVIVASSNDVFTVNWTWDAVPGADGYRLLRNWNDGGFTDSTDVVGNNSFLDTAWTGWGGPTTVTPAAIQSGASVRWNPTVDSINNFTSRWGIIDALAFCIDDVTDSGPYDLYIDNFQNGTTVFQTFETAPAGTTDYFLRAPSFSGSTSAGLLAAPNVAAVVNSVSDAGTKSMRVRWQWASLSSSRWLRLTTSGVGNPVVDMDQPISLRILLQPVGATLPTPPAAPVVTVSEVEGQTVLNWPGGHRLQTSVSVTGTYTNVPQVLSPNVYTNVALGAFLGPWTNNYTEPARFFRLVD